jgi:hypothetical protein
MNCKYCGLELPAGSNPRREFCNDAHKQAYWRQQQKQDQDAALLAELESLRAKVADQANEIEELTSQITDLRERLDIERRYLSDIKPHTFKAWLKKQPTSPLISRMFADPLFPARGPRSFYAEYVRLHYSAEELEDFTRLWKLMLLQS